MNKLKIALFHNLPSGGAKRHTQEQLRELSRRGYIIDEFVPSTADLSFCSFSLFTRAQHIFDAPRITTNHKRIPFLTPYINMINGLAILHQTNHVNKTIAVMIDNGDYDLVLVKDCYIILNPFILRYLSTPSLFQCHHGRMIQVQPPFQQGGFFAFSRQLKKIYYFPSQYLFQKIFFQAEKQNIRMADRVLTNSNYSQKLLSSSYQIQSYVLYPGINTDTFQPSREATENFVISVGSITYQKGHRFLITALSKINPRIRPSLWIISNRNDPIEQKKIQDMAIASDVRLHIEKVNDDTKLKKIYNQARAFIYAPIQEALGMAPLEAMACGTPVVAVGEAGVRETVLDGVTGFLTERDPIIFAERLTELLQNRNLHQSFSLASIEYINKFWTWKKAVDNLENHFQELLSSKNGS